MSTRDISDTFKQMYDVEVSPTLISKVTEGVMEEVISWQNRPLDSLYPVLFWDSQYPSISKSWQANWENLISIFDYPDEIRRIIYTTNAIEQASRKWSMPIREWKPAINRFALEYEGRFNL